MNQDRQKKEAAEAALEFISSGDVIGVGTGSTTNFFIEALVGVKSKLDGVVPSSEASAERLRNVGIRVVDLNRTGDLPLYVDGADEATRSGYLIKGGGGALTREKLLQVPAKNLSVSLTNRNCRTSWVHFHCPSK